ncbi:MAG TPA: helix-turn-helix domain-containing protein [Burkholderiaceae bacterium]|nr:helix-turn-helix domain-containing protein [Burkholderiaceae bacterium]
MAFEGWLERRHGDVAAARDGGPDATVGERGKGGKGERTRARLLVAAARQLASAGYAQMGIGEICEAAGVTRTALYRHFPSKKELVLALVAEFQQFLGDALREGRRPARAGTDDAVLATNLAYVRLYRAHARLVHAVQEVRHLLDDAQRMKFEMNEQWARKVALAIDAGAATGRALPRDKASREAMAKAYALEAMVDGFLAEWILRRNPHLAALHLSDEDIARVLTEAWRGVLQRR